MSLSEIAFLAVGIVIGTAVGAAIIEAARARPAPTRQVRVTIAQNSVHARRAATLADPSGDVRGPIPGSPEDVAWAEGIDVPAAAASGAAIPTAGSPVEPPIRTRVPSPPVTMPRTAIAVPVAREAISPVGPGALAPASRYRPPVTTGPDVDPTSGMPRASAGTMPAVVLGAATATAVLDRDPVAPLPSSLDVGGPGHDHVVRTRLPGQEARPALAVGAVAVAATDPLAQRASAHRDAGDAAGGGLSAPDAIASDPCANPRRLVDERCALATAARDHAKTAAETLREAQRAYDVLRERLDRAQATADPRGIAAAKDELHRQFRTASERAGTADDAEAAAREWLNAINELNRGAREAARFLESGGEELRAAMPRMERLAVEADAARIRAEGAEVGCQEARERLAACEENAAQAAREVPATVPEDAHPFDALWPGETEFDA